MFVVSENHLLPTSLLLRSVKSSAVSEVIRSADICMCCLALLVFCTASCGSASGLGGSARSS